MVGHANWMRGDKKGCIITALVACTRDEGSYCTIRREDGNVCSIRRLYVMSAILIYCTTYSCCVLYNYTDRKSTKCTKMGRVQYL